MKSRWRIKKDTISLLVSPLRLQFYIKRRKTQFARITINNSWIRVFLQVNQSINNTNLACILRSHLLASLKIASPGQSFQCRWLINSARVSKHFKSHLLLMWDNIGQRATKWKVSSFSCKLHNEQWNMLPIVRDLMFRFIVSVFVLYTNL